MKFTYTLKAFYGFLLLITALIVSKFFISAGPLAFLVRACKYDDKFTVCKTLESSIDYNSILFIVLFVLIACVTVCALVVGYKIHRALKASKTTTYTYEHVKRKNALKRIEHNTYKYNEEAFMMATRSKFFKSGLVLSTLLIVLTITFNFTASYESETKLVQDQIASMIKVSE